MLKKKYLVLILIMIGVSVAAAGCDEGPCMVTGTTDLTVYRLPTTGSDIFGTLPAGESHEILARTADGWVGFDPGIPQAPNVGLSHHRWIQLNATLGPFCDVSVPLVTLPDVLADMPPTPEPEVGEANMVITQVIPGAATLVENTFYQVDVTIQNQGDATASGYDLILIPHYGWGPPNPAGQSAVPNLAPGASHTINFSPGLTYSTPGTYTLRVILTDDWYTSTASLDSSGTAGDIKDYEIKVKADICSPFEKIEPEFVLLSMRPDTGNLPVYLGVEEGIFPGFEVDPPLPYIAKFGEVEASNINQQGFPGRAYFLFPMEGLEGTELPFTLWLPDCPDPVYILPAVLIPVPKPGEPAESACSADLGERACIATGGTYYNINENTSICLCP